jgi:hypothetical protein
MRAAISPVLVVLLTPLACGPVNIQQEAGFTKTDVVPRQIPAKVGDLVRFELRPPVSQGTEWDLETYNRVRFSGNPPSVSQTWVAEHDPIHLEAMVPPWDPVTQKERVESKNWFTFALRNTGGESQSLNRPVPIHRAPFQQLAPVTVRSVYASKEKNPRLWFVRTAERNEVTFKTVNDMGVPQLPEVRAALVTTANQQVLYAEVHSNFGEERKETVGYETTFSYPLTVSGPVSVVVVEWVGHGAYAGAFEVFRLTAPG